MPIQVILQLFGSSHRYNDVAHYKLRRIWVCVIMLENAQRYVIFAMGVFQIWSPFWGVLVPGGGSAARSQGIRYPALIDWYCIFIYCDVALRAHVVRKQSCIVFLQHSHSRRRPVAVGDQRTQVGYGAKDVTVRTQLL